MKRRTVILSSDTEQVLTLVGKRIRNARLRRNLTAEFVAESAGISKGTLLAVEKGTPTVSIGAYAAVLSVLGMEDDWRFLGVDEQGKRLYRWMQLSQRKRAGKRSTSNGGDTNI